ncbi:MAG TPA: branched-chain amino acid ABC transporter permease [Paracoccus sp. (in: a-proteobacteria)]|uniref:branched-chain amino acid ABC transporter permease n=1 Tax=uncultured Paracoccus sp. TaxID=189685 RepID=UPI002635265C|nr:branched-chain amino acid ABC transporter permease [uncultured Paracoccus sp.]HMQ40066.1 branched-chain amino acid ABC transporter permease [Paracoccus sp. (in: a-proteobacteria)]HMR35314.1 branched-chain amino acid ABC transporter permease [Paracoccus sp. (in: a-proteobacteria)]
MRDLSVSRSTPASTLAMAALGAALLVMFAAPWWAGRAELRLFGEIFLYMSLATLWNFLAGYAGLVSVGQQAYVGLGGYMFFAATMFWGLNPLLALPVAALIGAAISAPVAALIFRLRGAYFAIGTWVVAEVFLLTFAQVTSLGGGSGTSLPVGVVKGLSESRDGREALIYWLALGIAVLVVGAVFAFLRSRRGVALTAIRDNELAAKSLGIDIWWTKFTVYVVTAGLTTLVGGLIFLQKLRISPDAAFSVNDWTAVVIFIVVIGGIGTLEGPILGTLVYFALRETLADYGTIYLIALGVVAIAVMLFAPKGLWGLIRGHRGTELFPLSRRVRGLTEKGQ